MPKKPKSTSDPIQILYRRVYAAGPGRLKSLEAAQAAEDIARQIYELTTVAGLTQTQLANLIGTTASVICRLEDAEYQGHSLAMLRRIGAELNQRVEIRFVPVRRSA